MQFDPFSWTEIKSGVSYDAPKGRLRVMSSHPAVVYATSEGFEAIAGIGQEIDVRTTGEITFKVNAPAAARIFLHDKPGVSHHPEGEVFTNPDRLPSDSESMRAVKASLRLFQLEQRQILREMREQADKVGAVRKAPPGRQSDAPTPVLAEDVTASEADRASSPEPEPEPAPDAADEATSE